jgi:hypothetical protein
MDLLRMVEQSHNRRSNVCKVFYLLCKLMAMFADKNTWNSIARMRFGREVFNISVVAYNHEQCIAGIE